MTHSSHYWSSDGFSRASSSVEPDPEGMTLHAAACHACLFVPETSCERGNRYPDRAVLAELVSGVSIAFFPSVAERE